jgi:hypothetical protein
LKILNNVLLKILIYFSGFHLSTLEKWFAKFKQGEMSIEDDARSGRPKEAGT